MVALLYVDAAKFIFLAHTSVAGNVSWTDSKTSDGRHGTYDRDVIL